LFSLMWWARKQPRFHRFPGQLTIFLLALYGLERAVVEFFRRGATAPLVPGAEWITRAQLASVVAWIVLGALYLVLFKRAQNQRALTEAETSNAQSVDAHISEPHVLNAANEPVETRVIGAAQSDGIRNVTVSAPDDSSVIDHVSTG